MVDGTTMMGKGVCEPQANYGYANGAACLRGLAIARLVLVSGAE